MKNGLMIILSLLSLSFSPFVLADFKIDTNTGFNTYSDGGTDYTFSDTTNHIFLGASFGAKTQLYIGQNVTIFSNEFKTATTTKINTLELGPRVTYYFNTDKTIFTTVAWNPYAKGKRTTLTGTTEEISGYGLLAGLGYELKLSRNFFLGASLMYHSLNVSESVVNSVATKVSQSYTSITPMINLSLRFR